MLSKINLIIKVPSENILIVKSTQTSKWEFLSLFSNNTTSDIINSILRTVVDDGVENIKSINYLFEDAYKPYKESAIMPVMYYEIIVRKHIRLLVNKFHSYFRYFSEVYLNTLNNKSYDIEKYLDVLKAQRKEYKDSVKIYNTY